MEKNRVFLNKKNLFIFISMLISYFQILCFHGKYDNFFHQLKIKYNYTSIENIEKYRLIIDSFTQAKVLISELLIVNKIGNFTSHVKKNNCTYLSEEIINDDNDIIVFPELNNINDFSIVEKVCYNSELKNKILAIFSLNINISYSLSLKNKYDLEDFQEILKNKIIKSYLHILGFNEKYLDEISLPNNLLNLPDYLTKNLKFRKSIEKYYLLAKGVVFESNYKNNPLINSEFMNGWDKNYELPDIMSYNSADDLTLTEVTLNFLEKFPYYISNKCDFEYLFNQSSYCTRIDKSCMTENELKNYFIHYTLNNKNKVFCYLDSSFNIKNKQCGIKTGKLLYEELNICLNKVNYKNYNSKNFLKKLNKYGIPELNYFKNQKISLLSIKNNSIYKYPRTIFFQETNGNSNSSNKIEVLNKQNIIIEEEVIKDQKFFLTFRCKGVQGGLTTILKVIQSNNYIRTYSSNVNNLLIVYSRYIQIDVDIIKNPKIPRYMKIDYIPDFHIITYKDLLYSVYKIFSLDFPEDYNFMPRTFIYPDDKEKINVFFNNYKIKDKSDLWIIKPPSGSGGNGIKFLKSLKEIKNESYLLSKYIYNPHLLLNKKYDLRVYVLVSSIAPLKIYVYSKGLVRLASRNYEINLNNLDDYYCHLTNVQLNKKNTNEYKRNEDYLSYNYNKWSFEAYKNYLQKNYPLNPELYNEIRKSYIDIIIKTIILLHFISYDTIKETNYHFSNFFHIFGFDILVDENFNTYLLEVNGSPDLTIYDEVDKNVKLSLVADSLNIVGLVPFSNDESYEPYDKNMIDERKNEINEDVYESLIEFQRPYGGYERVFPLIENINTYKKYFGEEINIENKELWEKLELYKLK